MKLKRLVSVIIAVLMVVALVPVSALAETAASVLKEKAKLAQLDRVWEVLDAVEKEALASGANMSAVTMAVYKAAIQHELVDEGSFNSLTNKTFFFTVDGMACAYDYTARNYDPAEPLTEETVIVVPGRKNSPASSNIFLVGPYYGYDGSFTDQYRQEAQTLAEATGGDYILVQGHGATGPIIAENCPNAGVVIFDSHGTQAYDSSYLCLTTNQGITSEDYSNHWAVNAGSEAFIDGRYILHHAPAEMPNNFFWMAICEGMMRQGQGTTGSALIEAGAAGVYGYSQSVTFVGDYKYEATFWEEMRKEDVTVADAIYTMKQVWGEPEPNGDAWPIVMSPVDPFPTNPDGHQDVYCDWVLYPYNPVALESYTLSEEAVDIYEGYDVTVNFVRVPDNANLYELEWFSEDESIATVFGTNRKVIVTGVSEGATRICCSVKVDGEVIGYAYCDVNVLALPDLNTAANAEGGHLSFTTGSDYPWQAGFVDGCVAAMSGNVGIDNSSSVMEITVDMLADETFSFDWKTSSEGGYDFLRFFVNGVQRGNMSGDTDWDTFTYTAKNDGSYTFKWVFEKDQYVGEGDDCGYVKNVRYSGEEIIEPEPILMGDINGDSVVDASDALIALRFSLGTAQLTDEQFTAADMNGDGNVNAADALVILRVALQLR